MALTQHRDLDGECTGEECRCVTHRLTSVGAGGGSCHIGQGHYVLIRGSSLTHK